MIRTGMGGRFIQYFAPYRMHLKVHTKQTEKNTL